MTQKVSSLALCLAGCLPLAALGFSTDAGSSVAISLDSKVCLTNSPIQATITFTNGSGNALRGFFFTEQIPAGLAVTTVAVTLNGRAVTNFSVESGSVGDILPGYTPWRWKLETPTNFVEANPLPTGIAAQIVHTISSTSTGTFNLQGFSWAAAKGDKTNMVFGYSEDADQRAFKFVASDNLPLVVAKPSPHGFTLNVDGIPNTIYLLTASSNLVHWVPLATNLSPFTFTVTNWASYHQQYYRAAVYTGVSGNLTLTHVSGNSLLLWVDGVPGCSYRVERSTDLFTWLPITTNTPPFSLLATNVAGVPACFYRARLLPPP
jgi:uncharacterized repeat protein (TIGR01451 family)